MYYVDSLVGSIDRFEFDISTGSLGRRRHFADVGDFVASDGALVVADGLCVDAEDFV